MREEHIKDFWGERGAYQGLESHASRKGARTGGHERGDTSQGLGGEQLEKKRAKVPYSIGCTHGRLTAWRLSDDFDDFDNGVMNDLDGLWMTWMTSWMNE